MLSPPQKNRKKVGVHVLYLFSREPRTRDPQKTDHSGAWM